MAVVIAVIGLWNTLQYSLYGVPASGRVLEFHHPTARSMGVVMQVEVTLLGVKPFRDEIEDNFDTSDWVAGETTLPLRCIAVRADDFNCTVGSGVRLVVPVIFLVVGGWMMWWGAKGVHPFRQRRTPEA